MLETNVLTIIAGLQLKLPLVVCEHTDPRFVQHKLPWRFLRGSTYRFSDRVVVLNQYMKQWFEKVAGKRVVLIPNPISVKFAANFEPHIPTPFIFTAGRLIPTKRFDRMISLCGQLMPKYPDWRLVIAGEGELREVLQDQINRLGLEDKIHLIGRVDNVHDWMKSAEIFVSTSELEAFPMAISEAMMCAAPVVVMEYNESAHELIAPSAGFVIKNTDQQFKDALENLMTNPEKRREMGNQASRDIKKYEVQSILDQWIALFREMGLRDFYTG